MHNDVLTTDRVLRVKRCCSAGFRARWNSSTKNGTDLRLGVRALLIIARLTVDEKMSTLSIKRRLLSNFTGEPDTTLQKLHPTRWSSRVNTAALVGRPRGVFAKAAGLQYKAQNSAALKLPAADLETRMIDWLENKNRIETAPRWYDSTPGAFQTQERSSRISKRLGWQ
ncbi:hypothetical protein EVAR_90891_1 [Eumeta japonica]|uniref:Uncharacterized protein n=1 Tax=Eumeta variegata TaxID=151549 RepID=A0A4C1ZRC7_EUMVA|nr:hypothetical protein EVAR_90891_1 [Eumeta japonica]